MGRKQKLRHWALVANVGVIRWKASVIRKYVKWGINHNLIGNVVTAKTLLEAKNKLDKFRRET